MRRRHIHVVSGLATSALVLALMPLSASAGTTADGAPPQKDGTTHEMRQDDLPNPLGDAQRELREETGFRAREWARAGVLHPVISYSTEFIEIWFARGLTPGEPTLDAGEFLEVISLTRAELLDGCRDGRITDGKTLAAALWLQNVDSGAWSLDWQHVGSDAEAEPIMRP